MMRKSVKIQIDVSAHECGEALKDIQVITNITKNVFSDLEKQGYRASFGSIIKVTKNAVSLLLSLKKQTPLSVLTIYVPTSSLETIEDNVVTAASSSDIEVHDKGYDNEENNEQQTHSVMTSLPFFPANPVIIFSMEGDLLEAKTNFDYLLEYFKYSLSSNNKPMEINKILDDVCAHVFQQLNYSVNVRDMKQEISRHISHIVQSARISAGSRSVIKVLREANSFVLRFKSVIRLQSNGSSIDVLEFNGEVSSGLFLLICLTDGSNRIFQMHLEPKNVTLTFSTHWIEETLRSFKLTRVFDVADFCRLVSTYCSKIELKLDLATLEEAIKSELLMLHITNSVRCFTTVRFKIIHTNQNNTNEQSHSLDDELECVSEDILNSIIGRTYDTRGVKHCYEEDPISVDVTRNKRRKLKKVKDKCDLLHLKDTFHLSDSALNAIFQYIQQNKKIYSLREIELLRKETNSRFPIVSTKTSAYIQFAYAVRTALFVAQKYQPKLFQFDKLNIRFNMDGTLIGNKHIVAISINCIEGGPHCQSAKNLVPLGLFEVQKENTEILRKSLSAEFISHVKALKHVSVGGKDIEIHLRLGGDLMNAVYVFGLAGFSSNFPCIFCTQHKDDLHVTEDTGYNKVVTEGKGKNRQTSTVHVGPTSCFDSSKKARSLVEQNSCLAKGSNELGYKSEPLFGDLFDYKDYCIDTLHMKLRVFDVILKDILSCASRTGKYGAEHLTVIQKKIELLNAHCERTVGKRFFFQIDSDDKNKTIASHGKLSGHLQDIFFIDSFPYEEILDANIARSVRNVVNKFKEILRELKRSFPRQRGTLKRLSLDFVKEFHQAGLRTTVTPYIHIIGNHLFEFDDMIDLGDYNMQGVEKNNDLLSRLYFSSTNPAKNPLRTMLQKLYRMLEMNFNDRNDMISFASTNIYDFSDNGDFLTDDIQASEILQNGQFDIELDSPTAGIATGKDNDTDEEESTIWSPEKRFKIPIPRSTERFKSFRRS